jgi:hypothetical protein
MSIIRGERTVGKVRTSDDESTRWTAAVNSTVREFLDHIARELADEYVRLMKADEHVGRHGKEAGRDKK